MKRVLIAGATGYLGHYAVKQFKKQGYWVRALARNLKKLENLKQCIDEEFTGEVTDPSSLNDICKDIDIVFSSIGITRQKDNLTYMDVDYQGNKNLLEQAQKGKVSKFIYISVLNAHLMSQLKGIQAKEKFVDELKNSGIDYTVIYPNAFFSDMLDFFKMAEKGRAYVFAGGKYRINPIHGEDLAEVCVKAVELDREEINVGGPETFSHRRIAELAFHALNKKAKITSIPTGITNIVLPLLRTFTSVKIYGPLEFFMTVLTMDMIGGPFGKKRLKDFYIENAQKH